MAHVLAYESALSHLAPVTQARVSAEKGCECCTRPELIIQWRQVPADIDAEVLAAGEHISGPAGDANLN